MGYNMLIFCLFKYQFFFLKIIIYNKFTIKASLNPRQWVIQSQKLSRRPTAKFGENH